MIIDERFKLSTDIIEKEFIEPLRHDYAPFCGFFDQVEDGIKQKTLTGFSSVAKFLQVEVEVSPKLS